MMTTGSKVALMTAGSKVAMMPTGSKVVIQLIESGADPDGHRD
jgi:hypothetical protein